MSWDDGDIEDIEFDDSEDVFQEEEDLEDIDDWDDIEVATSEAEEIDGHIKESSDGELIHHFDFVEDALEYARGAPDGVLTVVIDEDGAADVYREDYA